MSILYKLNVTFVQGPNMYILLTGFYKPELPHDLIDIGVTLSCILRLENFRTCESSAEHKKFSAESSTTVLAANWLGRLYFEYT